MSIAFVCFLFIILVITPNDVVLSVLIGVGGYGSPMSNNVFRMDITVVTFRKRPPSSASVAGYIIVFRSVVIQCIGPFSFGNL